jgi:hypothetical protein
MELFCECFAGQALQNGCQEEAIANALESPEIVRIRKDFARGEHPLLFALRRVGRSQTDVQQCRAVHPSHFLLAPGSMGLSVLLRFNIRRCSTHEHFPEILFGGLAKRRLFGLIPDTATFMKI